MPIFSVGKKVGHRILASIGQLSATSSQLERSLLAMISMFIENENKYVSFLIFEKLQSNSKRIEFIDDLHSNVKNHKFWPLLKINLIFFFLERNKIVHGTVERIDEDITDYVIINAEKYYKKSEIILVERKFIEKIIEHGKLLCAGSMCVLHPIDGHKFEKTILEADSIRRAITDGRNSKDKKVK